MIISKQKLALVLSSALLASNVAILYPSTLYAADRNFSSWQTDTTINSSKQDSMEDFTITQQANRWDSGFSVSLNLNNLTDEIITDWTLTLHSPTFEIDSIWCATSEKSGDSYIIHSLSWNASISGSGYINFGFKNTISQS